MHMYLYIYTYVFVCDRCYLHTIEISPVYKYLFKFEQKRTSKERHFLTRL